MQTDYKPIAETNNFIVLDKYFKIEQTGSYQTEADLERELITDLARQGYEYRKDITSHDALLANVRDKLQALNNVTFTDAEWQRFLTEYLDRPSENVIEHQQHNAGHRIATGTRPGWVSMTQSIP